MKQFTSASGFVTVRLTSADISGLMQRLTTAGILLFHIQYQDALNVNLWLRRTDFEKLKIIAERQGASIKIIMKSGIYWMIRSILCRPILILGVTLILSLSWFVPTRVFFISVQGNTAIPERLILEKAAQCGITFGASRREVRSEKMKNSLLSALPQLQWTGINTYGCTAVISVAEKASVAEPSAGSGVSSIVAARDGIVYSCTVTSGNPLCQEGQAVQTGETLVSGYTDCGIKIKATRAKAEILAQTMRSLTVKSPINYVQKGDVYAAKEKYSLILGKKRINFSKDSGISPTSCDKMYVQYYCVLPGGFQLPIAVSIERWYYRKADPVAEASEFSQVCAQDFAKAYLMEQMLSGRILKSLEHAQIGDDIYSLTGRYLCLEMIGRERCEEIIKHNGKSD